MAAVRQLFRGASVYGFGSALNRLMAFLLLPVFTRHLAPDSYGVMGMLAIVGVVFSGVFSLGVGNSLAICYFREENARGRVIWTAVALLAANSAVWLAGATIFADRISMLLFQVDTHAGLVLLSLTALAINTVAIPFTMWLRMENRARAFVVLSAIGSGITIGLSVLGVVVLQRGVRGILEGAVGGAIALLCMSAAVVTRQARPRFDRRVILPLVRLGFPSVLGLGAFFVIDLADRAMIERMVGLAELGIYTVGYTFGMIIVVLTDGAFGSAWPAFFATYVNRREEAAVLFARILRYLVIILGFIVVAFFAFARPLVTLMTAPAFHPAHTVIGIVAAAYALKACYLVMLPPLYFDNKLHLQSLIEWGAAAVNLGLNLLLIPLWHKEGAALATLSAYFFLAVAANLVARRYLPVRYEWPLLGRVAAVLAAVAAVAVAVMSGDAFVDTVIGMFIIAGAAALLYMLGMTTDERRLLRGWVAMLLATRSSRA